MIDVFKIYRAKYIAEAVFELPSAKPFNEMLLFKFVSHDTFRRLRKDDDSLGEELRFERDSSSKVIRLIRHDNFKTKMK